MIVFIEDLNELRERIKGIDYSILTLISRRIELAKEVGRLKVNQGLPIKNFQVEKQVYERIERFSNEFALDFQYMQKIYEVIIEAAVSVQMPLQKQKGKSFGSVLIIGGSGKMGSWFADFFSTSGYSVEILDPIPHPMLPAFDDANGDINKFDLIAVCCPLNVMKQTLSTLISQHPRGIVFDIASLKSQLLEIEQMAKNENVRYVSVHPMFGPDAKHLVGRNLLICHSPDQSAYETVMDIFIETSANIVPIPMQMHDKFMIYCLGLPHFVNLLVGKVLFDSGIEFQNIQNHAGTTMLKQLSATMELFSENPELYHSIQNLNDYKDQLYTEIEKGFKSIVEYASNPDGHDFSRFMNSTREFFEEQD